MYNEKVLKGLLLKKIKRVFVTFSNKKDFNKAIKTSLILSKIGFLVVPHISYSTKKKKFLRFCSLFKTNKINNIFLLKGDRKKISRDSIIKNSFLKGRFKNIYSALYPDFHKKTINLYFEKKRIKKKISVGVNRFVTQVTMNLFSLLNIDLFFPVKKKDICIGVFIFEKIEDMFFFYKICGVKLPFFFVKNFAFFLKKKKNFFFKINSNFLKLLNIIGFRRFHLYSLDIGEILDFVVFLKDEKNWINRI
ncbi:methylenetetrahydrofolate reductase [Candidatus Vidania fulgoroideae]|nr:methylenetetrahydrofolate reductase [Candidatus Vidania fulgoroideae]